MSVVFLFRFMLFRLAFFYRYGRVFVYGGLSRDLPSVFFARFRVLLVLHIVSVAFNAVFQQGRYRVRISQGVPLFFADQQIVHYVFAGLLGGGFADFAGLRFLSVLLFLLRV